MDQQILEEGVNTGVIIDVRPTDYIAGGETKIAGAKILAADGQYDTYLPDEETQWKPDVFFDTSGCLTFSALNCLESIFAYKLATNQFSQKQVQFLKDEGYVDRATGKVNFSDRYIAKLSGTTTAGNSFGNVGDAIRKYGLIPEKEWTWPEGLTSSMPVDEKWKMYYVDVPPDRIEKGQRFLDHFEISYQWIVLGTSNPDKTKEYLKYGPLQIASLVCSPWSSTDGNPPIPACGCGAGHGTMIYGYQDNGSWKLFDSYKGFRKLLAADYCIPWVVQYYVEEKAMPVPPGPFHYIFNVNLSFGMPATHEVTMLQGALQYLKSKATGLPYLKPGVFGPYGPQTKVAVAAFQAEHSVVDPAPGEHFGPQSRAAMNAALNVN